MNFFTNTKIFKKIVIAILLVMIFNFITPFCTIVRANVFTDLLKDFGGALFGSICDLFLAIGDWLISAMQKWFFAGITTDLEEKAGSTNAIEDLQICYGPGIIFANEVPSLDVNFFNPKSTEKKVIDTQGWTTFCMVSRLKKASLDYTPERAWETGNDLEARRLQYRTRALHRWILPRAYKREYGKIMQQGKCGRFAYCRTTCQINLYSGWVRKGCS